MVELGKSNKYEVLSRQETQRGLADTEYLTREVASLRIAMRDIATRDFVRSELRSLLEELDERGALAARPEPDEDPAPEHSRATT